MDIINEIQTDTFYTQDIPEEHLRTLVNINALVHVQTTINDTFIHRYFGTPADAHEYLVVDHRWEASGPPPAGYSEQIVPDPKALC